MLKCHWIKLKYVFNVTPDKLWYQLKRGRVNMLFKENINADEILVEEQPLKEAELEAADMSVDV